MFVSTTYVPRIEEIYEIRLDRKEALQFQKKWSRTGFFSSIGDFQNKTALSVVSTKMKECLAFQFHSGLAFFTKNSCLICSTE